MDNTEPSCLFRPSPPFPVSLTPHEYLNKKKGDLNRQTTHILRWVYLVKSNQIKQNRNRLSLLSETFQSLQLV